MVIRWRIELTFQVAMRMANRNPNKCLWRGVYQRPQGYARGAVNMLMRPNRPENGLF
jgi:hypothetical protein